MGFDPDHTVEHTKKKEADEIWEKLKYVEPEHTTVDTEEILDCLKRITANVKKTRESFQRMEESLEKMNKGIDKIIGKLREKK